VEPRAAVCYDVGVRRLACVLALTVAACTGGAAGPHWPKSAGAMTAGDPDDDGGESLEPHSVSKQAAAVEHGGDDLTDILDEPPATAPAASVTPATGGAADPTPADDSTEGAPAVDDVIIVN
jgi:hypothetical protein